MKIAGAIFDLDGVLLDSMFLWDTLGETYLRSQGIQPRADINEVLRPMSLLQAATYLHADYGINESVQEIMDGINRLVEHYYVDFVKPKPGVMDFLDKLKNNQVKMCITTATDRFMVDAALKRNKMEQYFERIFTCTEAGHGKDEPDIYLQALDYLGTSKKETMVFEDALYAIKTAKNADFSVVAVYDNTARFHQAEIIKLADVYITTFEEMELT